MFKLLNLVLLLTFKMLRILKNGIDVSLKFELINRLHVEGDN